jgi:hypothetical protein
VYEYVGDAVGDGQVWGQTWGLRDGNVKSGARVVVPGVLANRPTRTCLASKKNIEHS